MVINEYILILLTFRRCSFRQTIFFFFHPLRATIFLNQRRGTLNFTRTIRNTTGRVTIIPQSPDHHHLENDFIFFSVRSQAGMENLFSSFASALSPQPSIATALRNEEYFPTSRTFNLRTCSQQALA